MKSCLDCKDRHPLCHDNCDSYKELKHEKEIINNNYRNYMDSINWGAGLKQRKFDMKRGEVDEFATR